MSIFKPSVAYPNLQEINLEEPNVFTCQINTTGESVKAYKLTILSEQGDDVLYDGDVIYVGDPEAGEPPVNYPRALSVPVYNKKTLNIPIERYSIDHYAKIGTPFYEDQECTIKKGTLTSEDSRVYLLSKDEDTGKINSYATVAIVRSGETTMRYIKTPDINFIPDTIINGKNYQWGVRVYNTIIGSTNKPNTTVCSGFLVGSTKNVIWSQIESTDTDSLDPIVYDRYIEFVISPEEISPGTGEYAYKKLVLGKNEDTSVELPIPESKTDNYIERKKIDYVTKELGKNKDYIKIETTEDFEYNFADGVQYNIYKCSSEHTVNSAFADPNSNINVANYIMIYKSAADAKVGFEDGENPKSSSGSTGLIYPSRKITGYSSDTGEIRVDDAFSKAPVNGQAYRAFEYNSISQTYSELFTSDLVFEVPSETTCYATTLPASTDDVKIYYYDTFDHMVAGGTEGRTENTEQVSVDFAVKNSTPYYYFVKKSVTYYASVTQVSNPKTSKSYNASDVNQYRGIVTQESVTYYVQYSNLTPKLNDVVLESPFEAQVIGGRPIENSKYIVLSNRVDDDVQRIFIQPNVNIKTDDTNYNQIIFENDSRIGIKKQLEYNTTIRKWNDVTFEKLDNSQWLLQGDAIAPYTPIVSRVKVILNNFRLSSDSDEIVYSPQIDPDAEGIPTDKYGNIQPQTDYTVYTDFMDISPYSIFYARKAPTLMIKYRNSYDKIIDGILIDEQTFQSSTGEYAEKYNNLYLYHDVNSDYYYRWNIHLGDDGEFEQTSNPWKYLNDYEASESNPSTAREMQFKAVWLDDVGEEITDIPFDIKNYQYTLYAYDKTFSEGYCDKEVIGNSGTIYNHELTWTFKGFDGTKHASGASAPHKYTLTLNIMDEYDKDHSKENDIYVKYDVEESAKTIDVSLDCDNHSLDVELAALTYAITVDSELYETVDVDDIVSETEEYNIDNYLNIPDGEILNYRKLVADDANIAIQKTMTFFAQFKITQSLARDFTNTDLLTSESPIFTFCHDLNDDGSEYPPDEENANYEYITLKLNTLPENYKDWNGNLVNNPDWYCLKLYRNGEVIDSFVVSGGTSERYNVVYPEKNIALLKQLNPSGMLYVIQDKNGDGGIYKSYSIKEYLNNPNLEAYDENIYYIIQNDYAIEIPGGINKKGVYHLITANNKFAWENVNKNYVIFDNINQTELTYEELQVPAVCRGVDGELLYKYDDEENLLWVDNLDPKVSELYEKWISIYIVIDNTTSTEKIVTYVEVE